MYRYVKQIHQPPPLLQAIIPPKLCFSGGRGALEQSNFTLQTYNDFSKMYKMLRDRMVVLFLLLPFYFNSFQNQTDKKPEANSSARKLIINHKQNYSLYPNLVS